MQRTTADLDAPALASARGRMALPMAAGGAEATAEGTQVRRWAELVDPGSGLLDQVAADWAARGGFDDERRPWVLTVFGLSHQLTHGTVAHLALQDRVLDLSDLRVRLRHTGSGRLRASGLVLDDPAPAWTGTLDELVAAVVGRGGRRVRTAGGAGGRARRPRGRGLGRAGGPGDGGLPRPRRGGRRRARASSRPASPRSPGARRLTTTEDDPAGPPPGWRARRTTCCQWWQSAHEGHYCRECPLHLSPRAAVAPLPTDH